jgi:hypothetical protein
MELEYVETVLSLVSENGSEGGPSDKGNLGYLGRASKLCEGSDIRLYGDLCTIMYIPPTHYALLHLIVATAYLTSSSFYLVL